MLPCEEGTDEHSLFLGQMGAIEAIADAQFDMFQIIGFTKQVVAGMIYQVKIRVKDGEQGILHAKIFVPLPHTQQAPEVQNVRKDQSEESPFDWEVPQAEEMKDESEPQQIQKSISSLVKQDEVTMIMDMGFSKIVAEKSLFMVQGGGIPKAMEWIDNHREDADFEEELFIVE